MPIIGTLPNNIQNGQTVDATPVMADFNFIVNQVNANANPTGTLTAPSGTRTIFHQLAAPVGWTIDATITDHTIQIDPSNAGLTGGVNGYSTMFALPWTSDGHALTTAELAAHNHGVNDPSHTHTDSGHSHIYPSDLLASAGAAAMLAANQGISNTRPLPTNSATANIQASATGISIQNAGSGTAHSHTKTFNVLVAAVIMCQKT
jgi:hypothetical protein